MRAGGATDSRTNIGKPESLHSCFSSRLYGLRKYKAKVKKIVDGVDPCSDSAILFHVVMFEYV